MRVGRRKRLGSGAGVSGAFPQFSCVSFSAESHCLFKAGATWDQRDDYSCFLLQPHRFLIVSITRKSRSEENHLLSVTERGGRGLCPWTPGRAAQVPRLPGKSGKVPSSHHADCHTQFCPNPCTAVHHHAGWKLSSGENIPRRSAPCFTFRNVFCFLPVNVGLFFVFFQCWVLIGGWLVIIFPGQRHQPISRSNMSAGIARLGHRPLSCTARCLMAGKRQVPKPSFYVRKKHRNKLE